MPNLWNKFSSNHTHPLWGCKGLIPKKATALLSRITFMGKSAQITRPQPTPQSQPAPVVQNSNNQIFRGIVITPKNG